MATEKKKGGRPSDYMPEVANDICALLSSGESLRKVCERPGMPSKTSVFRWLAEHQEFRDQYAKATETRADSIFEEIFEIADDVIPDAAEVAKARLRVDTRKWALARMNPRTNLVSLLKTLTPSSGELAPFFDTVNNKMVVFNENKTLFFKLSIVGTWPSGTVNRSMQLTFSGSVPDTLVSSRNSATTTDNILLATFFSVDKDGFLATNGSTLTIQSNGAAFTATTIKIIAEQ
ncbi:TPA: tail needle knob protein [Escherichia coli]